MNCLDSRRWKAPWNDLIVGRLAQSWIKSMLTMTGTRQHYLFKRTARTASGNKFCEKCRGFRSDITSHRKWCQDLAGVSEDRVLSVDVHRLSIGRCRRCRRKPSYILTWLFSSLQDSQNIQLLQTRTLFLEFNKHVDKLNQPFHMKCFECFLS